MGWPQKVCPPTHSSALKSPTLLTNVSADIVLTDSWWDAVPFSRAHSVNINPSWRPWGHSLDVTVPCPCTTGCPSCTCSGSQVLLLTQLLMTPGMLSLPLSPCVPFLLGIPVQNPCLHQKVHGHQPLHTCTCAPTPCLPSEWMAPTQRGGRTEGMEGTDWDIQTQRDVEQHCQGSIRFPPSSPHQQALT